MSMNFISAKNSSLFEQKYFMQCPMCEQWVDKREPKQFLKHVHGLNQLMKSEFQVTTAIQSADPYKSPVFSRSTSDFENLIPSI